MKFQKIARLFMNLKKREMGLKSTEYDPLPLSPCIIDPYITIDGKQEENKGYRPVSLLMKAIDDDKMLNIAVTGNYGGGKSSIIKTAEKVLSGKHHFINISLASLLVSEHKATEEEKKRNKSNPEFELQEKLDTGQNDKNASDAKKKQNTIVPNQDDEGYKGSTIQNKIEDKQIEYSILQQIIYHDRPQKTPKSKLRRVYKTKRFKPLLVSLYILAVMVSIVVLLKPQWADINRFLSDNDICSELDRLLSWIAVGVIGICVIIACCYVGKRFNFSFIKVGNKNVEIAIEKTQSIFNFYLDEIVYFFDSTDYDVVVFEDLDRFQSREVLFYKLRELNTILNNSLWLKRKINFVYAVLDDLFDATERVKFFDYIITVIPVVNSLNSYEKLKEYIQPKELFDKLGKQELYNLCDYIQDMRLLLNIVNEFNQFVPLLDASDKEMTEKKLFGLIVYKNYVPSDFSMMYNKKGVVASAIENVDLHKQEFVDERLKAIDKLNTDIKNTRDNLQDKITQLRLSILNMGKQLLGYTTNNTNLMIGDSSYVLDRVAHSQVLFDSFRKGNASYVTPSSIVEVPSFESIEDNIRGAGCYDEDIKAYKSENEDAVNELEKQKKILEEELSSIPTTVEGIYQLDTKYLDNELKPLKNKEKIDLVKFLFLNGYFDFYYQYYISHFYANSLTREEMNFTKHAARFEGVHYEVRLKNIDEILKRFASKDFAVNNSLLNLSLLKEIFENDDYTEYRDPVCQGIKRTKNFEFLLLAYHSKESVKDVFYFQLLSIYDYWDEIAKSKDDEKDDLREIYIRYCSVNAAKNNIRFINWLSMNYSFLSERWDVLTTDRLIKVIFKESSPRFRRLNLKSTPIAIARDIYDNGRYSFNDYNVKEIANSQGVLTDYSIASYTTICKLNNAPLLNMVKNDWTTALKDVFPGTSVHEDEEIKVGMINDSSIPDPVLRAYLSRQRNRIKLADKIRDKRLSFAYDNSLVEASWKNVYYYSIIKGMGLPLRFMEKNTFKTPVMLELNKAEEQELAKHVVFTDEISFSKYKEIVPQFSKPIESIIGEISRARIKFLVDNNYLAFNEANFTTVKVYGFSNEFLAKNVDIFVKAPEKYSIDSLDAVAALKADISKNAKCEFIRAVKRKDLSPAIDLVSLIRPYLLSGEVSVRDVSPRLLVQIVTKASENDRELLGRRAILSSVLNDEDIKIVLNAMGGDYRKLISRNSKTSTIGYSTNNMRIVNYLVGIGLLKNPTRTGDYIVVEKNI
ncbi:MAG: hypothetical protein J6T97_03155 [Bacteroidaceae bacterium]|nr:hypothetical protein [Bacteroidaceae bacterium]